MKCSIKTRILSLLLVVSLLVPMLSGCKEKPAVISFDEASAGVSEIDTSAIAEEIISEIQGEQLRLSLEWEDYVGDIETFVYGLLTHQLEYKYEVFPAYVELSDGQEIYGLAYTDYSECYTNEDESQAYFAAGMITLCGENAIPQEEFEQGLTITSVEYQDDEFGFFMKYASDAFTEHCVVFGQYLQYGVNTEGQVYYTTDAYVQGNCDETLGSLYSYDEQRYLLDLELGEYTPISGVSLSSQIDYVQLEQEINKILESQDADFAQVDIESSVYYAQEAVVSYLLSLQEETFFGYDVDLLIQTAQDLDPKECLQMTPGGYITINVDDVPGEGATPLVKWLVGSTCIIVAAVGMVGSVVAIECPPLSSVSGAITGAAIDVFMQVVISGQAFEDIEWSKVVLSSVTGAIAGYLGPYLMAASKGSGLGYFIADSMIDGLLGGIEQTVSAWMDGEKGLDLVKSFGQGVVLGFALSAGFKGAGVLVKKIGEKVGDITAKVANKVAPNLTSKISAKFANVADVFIKKAGGAFEALKTKADSTPFHSKYIAKKMSFRQLEKLVADGMEELSDAGFNNLTNAGLVDPDGNPITKEALKKLFKNARDGKTIATIVKGDDIVNVVKKNGVVGIEFDKDKFVTVDIKCLVADRNKNFEEAAKELKKVWLQDPTKIPDPIKKAIDNSGIKLEDMGAKKIVSIIKDRNNGYVLHENLDMKTITLVARELHDTVEGGIAHMGGYSIAKYVKAHMGSAYFERLLAAASSGLANAMN